jgi:hypothetical protein
MMMRDNVWRLVNTVVRPLNPPIVGELDDVALERIKVLSIRMYNTFQKVYKLFLLCSASPVDPIFSLAVHFSLISL